MKQRILVDLRNENSFVKYQKELHNSWEFNNISIVKILEKHKEVGIITPWSAEHYIILRELIDEHLAHLDEPFTKEAYIASKKAHLLTFHNPSSISSAISLFLGLLTIYFSTNKTWDIHSVIATLITFALWVFFTCASSKKESCPARQFYAVFFANIEKDYDKDS